MNDSGYIYILINPSMEGLIKIGKTNRNPKERAEELSKATGVPTPFIVAYEMYVNECTRAEKFVHTYLEGKGYRLNSNREFFNVPLTEAINIFLEFKNTFLIEKKNYTMLQREDKSKINCNIWDEYERLAHIYYFGDNNTFQNYTEALKLFKKSAILGSAYANKIIGMMYYNGLGCKKDREIALKYLNIAAQKGEQESFGLMSLIYFELKQINNGRKAWEKYTEFIIKLEKSKGEINHSLWIHYVLLMYRLHLPIERKDILVKYSDEMFKEVKKQVEECRSEGGNVPVYLDYIANIAIDKEYLNLLLELKDERLFEYLYIYKWK